MHLKKLIISGFKSFADKVTLTFDEGITGIVGPNGSGKSNVIDAVRWVMGEQNAKYLRGQVATDIIFAGSEKRKALGMAEVTLVFDNSDASAFCPPEYRHEPEISLTRRLYIDGQREYLINRKPCRLKDIVGFFAITGLGGRSYSMIQQGQVDRILNAKPEDVREILEEAAGTLVFKTRRGAAQKKLENTNENLKRIEDIVAELGKQLDTLETQVEKAKIWKELSTDLRDKELALFAHNYAKISTALKELQTEHDAEVDKEVELMSQVSQWEARLEELQSILSESDPELDEIREQVSSIREQIVRKESAIAAAMAAIENGTSRLEEIDRELEESRDNLRALEEQAAGATERMSAAQAERDRLQAELDAYQDEVDRIGESQQVFESRLSEMEDELRNLDHLLESNGLRCEVIERDRKRLAQERERLEERIQGLQSEVAQAAKQLEEVSEKVDAKQAGLETELAQKQAFEDELATLVQSIKSKANERDELKETYFRTRGRLTSLEELESEESDLTQALNAILEADSALAGSVTGVLTDFVKFSDMAQALPRLALTAIEKWTERMVVKDVQALNQLAKVAREKEIGGIAVSVLAENQLLDRQKIQNWAEEAQAQPLSDFVTVSHDDVRPMFDRLFYCGEDQISEALLNTLPPGVVVFTAQGLVFAEGQDFVLSRVSGHGALSRRAELEKLASELAAAEVDLQQFKDDLQQLEARQEEVQTQLRAVDEVIKGQNKDLFAVMGEKQSLSQLHGHKSELLDEAKRGLQQCEDTSRSYVKELEDLGKARISIGQERDNLENEIEGLKQDSGSVLEQNEEARRLYEGKKLELAKYEARTQALQENYEQSKDQFERLKSSLARREEEKDRIRQDMEKSRENEVAFKDDIQELIERREGFEEQLARKKEQHAEVMEEIQVVEARVKDAHKKQVAWQEGKTKRSLALEKMKYDLNNIEEQSREKYHLDIVTYEFEEDPKFDIEKSSKEIHRLREKIDGMGAINMMAIEEHEKLTERYSFITAQREEVLGSIRLLEEAIMEIEDTARDKFLATFAVINENFAGLFPILFPSGEARLAMTNEEDPLNSGVDIMVRLPGKKTQSMTLFSGGEKALTAISLIFALLKTKPTPFCFLDEVDAPLDEANVGRYNKVLEALSDRFQFIVITHNRRTMEVLDQLYGVTMQEAGVSKVVGVDMKKDLPAHLQKAFKQDKDKRPVEGASAQAGPL